MNRPAWSSLLLAAVALLAAGPVGAQGKPAADYPNRLEKWARVAKAAGIYQSQ